MIILKLLENFVEEADPVCSQFLSTLNLAQIDIDFVSVT